MDRAVLRILEKEYGDRYEDVIELEYECDLETFIDDIFPELMGEDIDIYIENESKTEKG